nr:MAG TPA: hypothetical protein [Caudoviricetes sp.]
MPRRRRLPRLRRPRLVHLRLPRRRLSRLGRPRRRPRGLCRSV